MSLNPARLTSLPALFRERVAATPTKVAYRHFDPAASEWCATSWAAMATEVGRWQQAFLKEGLAPGDRVAIMLRNSREWVVFDQAALGLGLVTVPLYVDDRPDNVAYIVREAGVKLLVVEGRRHWKRLQKVKDELAGLQRIVSVTRIEAEDEPQDERLESLNAWLFGLEGEVLARESATDELATIVYTSGTTGRPKGVMLSHRNILYNAQATARVYGHMLSGGDRFLSFLPLSHMLERTAGYYLPMLVGAEVVYARSVQQLADDLQRQQPTILISVPRIYERVYARIQGNLAKQSPRARRLFELAVAVGWHRFQVQQGRAGWHPRLLLWPLLKRLVADKVMARLGGRLRYAVCGGAALPPEIARLFIGLGLPLLQGYGLTETSPVISANRPDDNIPDSVGLALDGIEVRIGPQDELLTRSPSVMMGYWQNEEATRAAIDEEGWFHTGDQARIDEGGHIYITGRIKDIIVLTNGEKVPPADMEMAIALDPLIEQVMVIGEGRPFLAALVVLNRDEWRRLAEELGVDPDDPASLRERFVEKAVLARIQKRLAEFPGYAVIRRAWLSLVPWTVDDGLLTPTLKVKRPQVLRRHAEAVEALYQDVR